MRRGDSTVGVKQGDKIRQIDDFSRFFINASTTVDEHIDLDGVDQIVNLGKIWADLIEFAKNNEGWFKTVWEDGSWSWHQCHADYMEGPTQIQGATIDLESAYKQCPVAKEHERYSAFAVKNPKSNEVEFFLARALPFGAKASVHGFNRASRALNTLAHRFAGVTTGTYFDDYPMVAPSILSRGIYKRMIRFFTLLG